MTSKKLNAILDKVLLSPMEMETMAGRLEAAKLIRKAYALGRRERGVRVANGWVNFSDISRFKTDGRAIIYAQHDPADDIKVEVIRVK